MSSKINNTKSDPFKETTKANYIYLIIIIWNQISIFLLINT